MVCVFRMVETGFEEHDEDGQWGRQRREVEKEARPRVPEFSSRHRTFSAVFSFFKHDQARFIEQERAQRLLWLYQECLPYVIAEARLEVGKLILGLVFSLASGDPRNCNVLAILDQLLRGNQPFPDHPSICFGLRREPVHCESPSSSLTR
jgi:hypothetical protein